MERIILHWTAGTNSVSALDLAHYHRVIAGDGSVALGDHTIEDNANTRDGHYAAHTLNCNSGSIGVAVAGMAGAQQSPFSPGAFPITPAQVTALYAVVADLCRHYQILVNRRTVLTHAEVQPTLGIRQKGKWDITWLPGMTAAGDPVAVGDTIRASITARLGGGPTTRRGDRGSYVRAVQAAVGVREDGVFGPLTEAAVVHYQRMHNIKDSTGAGSVGPETWSKING